MEIKKIDIDKHIRGRPHLYFSTLGPNPEQICSMISIGALRLGATQVHIQKNNGWNYICADIDWLYLGKYPNKEEASIWDGTHPFPENGDNCCRYEVMVRVFSTVAFTWTRNNLELIVGELPSNKEIESLRKEFNNPERGIAFKFGPVE